MSDLWPLLIVAILASIASVIVPCVFWVMHAALSRRVAKLEAQQGQIMTHADAIQIHKEVSEIKGEVKNLARDMQTIQKYLREQGK